MMKKKVAVCSRSFSRNKKLRDLTLAKFSNVKFNDKQIALKDDSLVDYLKDAEGAIIALETVNEKLLKELPNLKYIGKYGVGTDAIDFNALEKFNVQFGWTGGLNKRAVSELVIALALDLSRNISNHYIQMKSGIWKHLHGIEISKKKVGIIGLGHIGKDLANLLKAFDCQIYANDILDIGNYCEEKKLINSSKEEIYKNCEIITIHIPYNSETENLITKNELSQMRKDAILINTSRGGIINEDDLYTSLSQNQIKGAGIDVFKNEPLGESPLLELSNFIATPHVAGSSEEAILALGKGAIENLEKLMK